MEGWVDLGYPAMHRPGTELATSRSRVRRPTTTVTEHFVLNERMMKTCNARSCRTSQIWGAGSRRAGWCGTRYTLRVVREVTWVFSRHLKVSNVFDSLIAAGNSFQIVGAEKLKERFPKLVVQKGIDRRFWLAEQRHRKGWYIWRRFLRYGGWFVDRLLCSWCCYEVY